MTPRQRDLARHALGIDRGEARNYFVTGPHDPAFADWQAMVAAGWATCRPYALCIQDSVFRLTETAEKAVRNDDPMVQK